MLGLTDDYQKLYADGEQTYRQIGFSDQDMVTLKATLNVNNYNAEDLSLYSQRRYLGICQVAQVTPPLLGRPSISIMPNSNYIMPSYMMILWKRLWKMTNNNQWHVMKI
jgi:hypothetical protein